MTRSCPFMSLWDLSALHEVEKNTDKQVLIFAAQIPKMTSPTTYWGGWLWYVVIFSVNITIKSCLVLQVEDRLQHHGQHP